jgi:hypothetical protein
LVTPRSSSASGDVGDLAPGDLVLDLLDVGLERLAGGVDLAEADASGLDVEHRVLAGLERPGLDLLGGVEHRDVDLLERRRHHVGVDVALVGVHADALDVLLLGGVERAESALTGDREDDLRALVDLVERDLLALRLIDEVLRVGEQRLDPRVGLLRAGLIARRVGVDRGNLLPADGRDDLVAALLLGVEARHRARQVAGLRLLEQ